MAFLGFGLLGCKKPGPPATEVKPAESGQKAATKPAAALQKAVADRAAARGANTLGMKAYKIKDYPAASEKFRAAIAADPGFPLPHYNLACVAALTGDKATAITELEFLQQSTAAQARRTLLKAGNDSDLKSIVDDPRVKPIVHWGGLFGGYKPLIEDSSGTAADAKRLKKAASKEDEECSSEPAYTATRTIKSELVADSPGVETMLISFAYGAVIFDASGKQIAAGGDHDCVGHQSGIMHVSVGQVVPDPEPEILIHYESGGRGSTFVGVDVLKRRGKELVTILTGVISSTEREGDEEEDSSTENRKANGWLSLEPDGTITSLAAGEKRSERLQWDEAKFQFVPVAGPTEVAPPATAAPDKAQVASAAQGCAGSWEVKGGEFTECFGSEPVKFLLAPGAKGALEVRSGVGALMALVKATAEAGSCSVNLKTRTGQGLFGDDFRYCVFKMTSKGDSVTGIVESTYIPNKRAKEDGLGKEHLKQNLKGSRKDLKPEDTVIDTVALAKAIVEKLPLYPSATRMEPPLKQGDKTEVTVEMDRFGRIEALGISGQRYEAEEPSEEVSEAGQLYNPTGTKQKIKVTISWPKM